MTGDRAIFPLTNSMHGHLLLSRTVVIVEFKDESIKWFGHRKIIQSNGISEGVLWARSQREHLKRAEYWMSIGIFCWENHKHFYSTKITISFCFNASDWSENFRRSENRTQNYDKLIVLIIQLLSLRSLFWILFLIQIFILEKTIIIHSNLQVALSI